ncbi:hypothetical protein [Paenibacillus sp. NEAU-GSW1]|uniref:hypothetical protein n=1 Tax=Paenibacillus sp. NEAU-GSW1 TaxID=2682486 RepID=UPI0012E24A43|nr:hypothetical protein [Paenibacillus sp. NEAU-GSW1]MUT67054.1 hypothetical protein [Paenibacillus sp. NEAU-GSW1]
MEQVKVLNAKMTYTKESGYVGQVQFEVTGFPNQYEITLHSRKATEWGYGLFFLNESGDEEQLLQVEDMLEEDDELFDYLVNAAQEKLEK